MILQNWTEDIVDGNKQPESLISRFVFFVQLERAMRLALLRKEVIHPHVPVGIPCYDLTPIISPALGASLPCGLGQRLQALPTLMV